MKTNFCVGACAVLYHFNWCSVVMYDAMTSDGCLSWALGDVVWKVNLWGVTSHMAYEVLTLNVMWPLGAHSQIKRHYVWRHVLHNLNWYVTCDVAVSPCTQVYNDNISRKYSGIVNRYEIQMVFEQLVQIAWYSFLLFSRLVLFLLNVLFVCFPL